MLRDQCQRRLNVLKVLAHRNWGADYVVLLATYQALIQTKLDYGAIVYNSAKSSLLKKLDIIQNTALRIILGAYRTSPTDSLQIEADVPPLDIRRIQLSLKYAIKVAARPSTEVYTSVFPRHVNNKDKIYERYSHQLFPFYRRVSKYIDDHDIELPAIMPRDINENPPWRLSNPVVDLSLTFHRKTQTEPSTYRQLFNEARDRYHNHQFIYTDGSKFDNRSGCAVITEGETLKYKLPDLYTIFSCELYAIKQALVHILHSECNSFVILSDSLSNLQSLQNHTTDMKLLQDVQNLYSEGLNKGKEIVFMWIPSHQGISGNEQADQAARDATLQQEETTVPVYPNDAMKTLTRKPAVKWKQRWSQTSSSKLCATRKGSMTNYPLKYLKRSEQILITRLRIGHTKLTHSYLLFKKQPPQCETCQTKITVQHLFTDCIKYSTERQKHGIPEDTSEALNNPILYNKILSFLQDSGLCKLI